MKTADIIVIGGANVTFDPAVALQRFEDLKSIAASKRNACALPASENFIGGELA